jgi:ABC-2 type transport system ATP-binding protein
MDSGSAEVCVVTLSNLPIFRPSCNLLSSMPSEAVVEIEKLSKTFRKPFSGKKVVAVEGVDLVIKRGDIVGFLGPNGAGKTTTLKMLTGLISPTSGRASIFGRPIPSPQAMQSVGFLPENPYVYPYLTPREFVSMCGRLSGMKGAILAERVEKVVERVGMAQAIDRAVRALSKGMLQRVGLAAALVHDPALLILDEPMSGLDPVGRKDVRDLILEEKKKGKTVFFSTHILNDVETLCDHVCILKRGKVVVSGMLGELLDAKSRKSEIALSPVSAEMKASLVKMGLGPREIGGSLVVEVEGDETSRAVLKRALELDLVVESVTPKRETLESIFVRRAL